MATIEHTAPAQAARASTRAHGVDVIALGWSLSIFAALSLLLCVAAGFVLPRSIVHILAAILPAFDWRDPQIIAVATVLAFACGWYAALVTGSLYNLFRAKR